MPSPPLAPAVFLDRDGTLMEEVDYCRDPAKVHLLPGVRTGLARLKTAGFRTVIITNQSGLGRGRIAPAEYAAVHARLLELLGPGLIDGTYYCPDAPGQVSPRRKPAPAMIHEAAHELSLDLSRSWLIGDKASDVQCGVNAGVRPILVKTGYGAGQSGKGAVRTAEDFAGAVNFILGEMPNNRA